jgi:DNA topoisomerase I
MTTKSGTARVVKRKAARVGLRYVNDFDRGITRRRRGRGFTYLSTRGTTITAERTKRRIDALAIPPAWESVWICSDPSGHIQARGRDDAGRLQYIYHEHWQAISSATKYDRMHLFAEVLPRIRRRIRQDMSGRQLDKQMVLAGAVRLMDRAHVRIGNEVSAAERGARGATTLARKHVDVERTRVTLDFPGKSGQQHAFEFADGKLAKVIRKCAELRGQYLFCYIGDDGKSHPIHSHDVNDYLSEIAKEAITAKDFRTWAGSVLALGAVVDMPHDLTEGQRKATCRDAVKVAAAGLGNTVAVCRGSYVHPALLAAAESNELPDLLEAVQPVKEVRELTKIEATFAALLPHLDFG